MNNLLKKKLNKYIEKLTKKTVGISAAIIEDDQTIYEEYFGFIDEHKTPNSSSKKMMIGSNTKILTTLAILQLYEKGIIDLDADISNYISDLELQSRFSKKPITIRNILMHRSGLASDDFNLITSKSDKLEDVLTVANRTPLSTEPGTTYAYSNIGYGLLGLIIERMSGLSYVKYIEEYIQKPLDVNFQFIQNNDKAISGNEDLSKSFNNRHEIVTDPLTTILSAGTGTYGTLEDMIKLLKVFIQPKKQKILKEETISLMLHKPSIENVIDGEIIHGLGLIFNMYNYNNEEIGEVISHGGDTIYHHSRFVFIPKLNVGFVVMTNTENGLNTSLLIVTKMMEVFFRYKQIKLSNLSIPKSKIKQESIEGLEGIYEGSSLKALIYKEKNELYVKIRFLKMKLQLREDNFYQLKPRGIARLPIFSGLTKNLLLQIRNVNEHKILYALEYRKNKYNSAKIGLRINKVNVDKYHTYKGTYKLKDSNENQQNVIDEVTLDTVDQQIKLSVTIFGQKQIFNVRELDKNRLEILGFGRYAGDTVTIKEKEEYISMKLFGFEFIKN